MEYKIIDIKEYGNVLRISLGKPNLEDWYGDDWNDTGEDDPVYKEFVEKTIDVVVPTKYIVRNAMDMSYERRLCKDVLKNGGHPYVSIGNEDTWGFYSGFDFIFLGVVIDIDDNINTFVYDVDHKFKDRFPELMKEFNVPTINW